MTAYPIVLRLVDGSSVVLKDPTDSANGNRNVWCFAPDNKIRWNIEHPNRVKETSPYTNIYIAGDGSLRAYNWNGFEYTIDIQTGAIIDASFVK